jgi:hypothetical protein
LIGIVSGVAGTTKVAPDQGEGSDFSGAGTGAGLSNPVWKVGLVSLVILPICFYCFYGHASGLPFPLPIYVITMVIMVMYLGCLGFRARAPKNVAAVEQLSGWQKGFLYFAVAVECVLLVCATVHYARFSCEADDC